MSNTRRPILAMAALLCVIVIGICAAVAGRSASPVSCTGTDGPVDTVNGFFDSLCGGDYAAADAYVADYSGLGLGGEPDGICAQRLFDELTASYSYELVGEMKPQTGERCYVQTVNFSHLDIDSAADGIGERFTRKLEDVKSLHTFEEIYDEEMAYRQEIIDEALNATLDEIFADSSAYIVTDSIDAELEYAGGEWRVVVSDKLADAIIGRTERG